MQDLHGEEWNGEELKQILGYIPQGFSSISNLWHPPMPDYNFSFNKGENIVLDSLSYIFSGLIGTGLCFITSYILLKGLSREN